MNAHTARTIIVCMAFCILEACAGGGGGGLIAGGGGGTSNPPPGGGNTNPLSYVTWGPWSAGGNVGLAPSGTMTPIANVPQTGTATYLGSLYTTNGKTGSTNITIDFAAASVAMGITIQNPGSSAMPSSISANGTGSLTGRTYDVHGQSWNYDLSASGALYGPSATETAGTFHLLYDDPFLKDTFDGTFGAKK